MSLHQTTLVMISRAFLTKIELFCFAENGGCFVLTEGALIVAGVELTIVSYRKINLVSDKILAVGANEEIILKGVLIGIFLNEHGVEFSDVFLEGAHTAETHLAQQKGKDLTGLHLGMNIDVSAGDHHVLDWNGLADDFVHVIFVEVSHVQHHIHFVILTHKLNT